MRLRNEFYISLLFCADVTIVRDLSNVTGEDKCSISTRIEIWLIQYNLCF